MQKGGDVQGQNDQPYTVFHVLDGQKYETKEKNVTSVSSPVLGTLGTVQLLLYTGARERC